MKFKDVLIGVIFPVVVGVITYFIIDWWVRRSNRIQYLDYYASSSVDLLQNLKNIGDSIALSINKKPVTDLSQLDISIFNNTDSDLENVPIFIELYAEDGKQIPIFSTSYYDHNDSKESIETQTASNSEISGGQRLGYLLKTANRSSKKPVFKIRFLIERKTVPRFRVQTSKKGLDVRELDISKANTAGGDDSFVLLVLVTTGANLIVFFVVLFRRVYKENLKLNITEVEALKKVYERIAAGDDVRGNPKQ